jgi:hypothetical protein
MYSHLHLQGVNKEIYMLFAFLFDKGVESFYFCKIKKVLKMHESWDAVCLSLCQ